MYRHGYQKANSSKESEWPIMEVKATDDPYADPWEKIREAKRARKDKNMESRMRNEERAGALPKGTTNRILKGREKSHKAGKSGGDMDRDQPSIPVGIPVDLRNSNNNKSVSPAAGAGDRPQLRGKASTLAALAATQRSTASLGKFDRMREGEPERRKVLSKLKKRKLEAPTDKRVIATEGERSMKILKSVVNGGGAAQENARRKGALAKGETAYDYDYDDGGNSGFHKKKGRAGSGKLRKMTKKRVK
jgi:regulator of ribosome biosynthesis